MTMGVIVGNRGFFPAHLAKTGREEMSQALQKAGIDVVVLGGAEQTRGRGDLRRSKALCGAF